VVNLQEIGAHQNQGGGILSLFLKPLIPRERRFDRSFGVNKH
jgi:hypothetical protein